MDGYRAAIPDFRRAILALSPAILDFPPPPRHFRLFAPVIPDFSPRHSREGGNPDGRNRARYPKPS